MKIRMKAPIIALLVGASLLMAGALIIGGLSYPAPVQAQAPTELTLPRAITVVGEGKVRVKPDIAQTNIGVEITGPTVKGASSEASDVMDKVMAAIKAQGIVDKDIQTAGYNIWVERPMSPQGQASTSEIIYHVSNSLMVTVRDLTKVGTVLDAAIESGANNVYGVTFSLADPGTLQSEARQKAVTNGKTKAEELARLNSVSLGSVISVSELIGGKGGYFPSPLFSAPASEGMGGGGGPIVPGELEIAVQLEISYAIK